MPAGVVAGSRKPCVRLSEPGDAFARGYLRRVETLVAFARSCPCGVETAVAFAGEKWVFFVRFSVAEVLSISALAVHGRAMVMVVSCWPASVPVEGARVSYVHCLNVGLGCSVGGGPPN